MPTVPIEPDPACRSHAGAARYRAIDPAGMVCQPLDRLTAVYHRRSGATHLLSEPLPQILDALLAGPADAELLAERLCGAFDVAADGDIAVALRARLEELVALGLAEQEGA